VSHRPSHLLLLWREGRLIQQLGVKVLIYKVGVHSALLKNRMTQHKLNKVRIMLYAQHDSLVQRLL
jgi:hypothetical protein